MFRVPPLPVRCSVSFLLIALSAQALACSGRLHIEVQESAVYALDYDAIVAKQPTLADCLSADLQLTRRDADVPIRIEGDTNGRFGPGSRIIWVGAALHGPSSWFDQYSNVNVYQLAASAGSHARLREVSAGSGPATSLRRKLHFEQENLMVRLGEREMKHGDEPDVWQWAKLTPVDPKPFTYTFDLPDLDAAGARSDGNVDLTLNFRGESNIGGVRDGVKPNDHVVEVSINDKLVETVAWDGRDELRKVLPVARALFKTQGNKIALRVPRREVPKDEQHNFIIDVVMLNWFEPTYPLRASFDDKSAAFVAATQAPIELTWSGTGKPALIGSDGEWRSASALAGRYRFAAAGSDVDLYPFSGTARAPALVRAVAEGDLRSAPGYDYLMVAHPRLRDSIEPLAQYHRDHGLKVAVVDVDQIYDQFGGGIAHPAAIRDFVAWGSTHWQIKPHYLLLVGDASADIHHDMRGADRPNNNSYALRAQPLHDELMMQGGLSSMPSTSYKTWDSELPNRNLIPTWQFPSSGGQSASDNGFVALKADEMRPQIAVGRFPVVQPEEVQAIVKKTIAYLSKPSDGSWRRDITFISTDEVSYFKQGSDKMASDLGARGFSVNNIYTKQDVKDAVVAHATLKRDLDGGNLLVHFLGHGGAFIWRVGPPADLFTLDDVSNLQNAGRYPMVLAMTCFSAPFDNPTEDSIGERFLREADRGAIAVFAASWTNSPNPDYSKILIEELLKRGKSIGDAIVAAKGKVGNRDFVEMYNLLGDPAIVLTQPDEKLQLASNEDRWNRQVTVQIPGLAFGGLVDVDWVGENGETLSEQRYESRNNRFALSIPSAKATGIRVYSADTRTGVTAFGGLNFAEPIAAPPAPANRTAPNAPAVSQEPARPPVSSIPVKVPAGKRPDHIARLGFDGQTTPHPSEPRLASDHAN